MIGTLAWKDYREHQMVWAAMAGLAIFLIVTLTGVFAPNGVAGAPAEKLQTIALAALILAGTYGLICGAMTALGGIGHTLPFLIPRFHAAMTIAFFVVLVDLRTPFDAEHHLLRRSINVGVEQADRVAE